MSDMDVGDELVALPAGKGRLDVAAVVDQQTGDVRIALVVEGILLALTPAQAFEVAESLRAEAAMAEAMMRRTVS